MLTHADGMFSNGGGRLPVGRTGFDGLLPVRQIDQPNLVVDLHFEVCHAADAARESQVLGAVSRQRHICRFPGPDGDRSVD
mmetsp:Transcript_12204/g.36738  ORF Transcript_12204/g.36738 Transcript_12204/m.36738 type:complete len:81 (+) Transcript_12204:1080-1322(+)